jgi:hypothetical protein
MPELYATDVRFASLNDALEFICRQVDAGNSAALAAAMAGLHPDDAYDFVHYFANTVFPALCARRRDGCLHALDGQEFPVDATRYTLGGPDTELSRVRIDFVRYPDGWALQRIWMVR